MVKNQYTRRSFLRQAALGAAGLAVAGCTDGVKDIGDRSGKKPHILLLMTDQHRADCLGCMGNAVIKTPHLDSIAADGVVFTAAYSSVPSCTPARSGLLTGWSPWHHGMLGYGRLATEYKYEMPRMIRESGYYTFGIGKMHWYPQKARHGFHDTLVDESGRVDVPGFVSDYRLWFEREAPGLDPDATGIGWNEHRAGVYALDEKYHPTTWTGQTAVELIDSYQREEPLFLKVSFARPHSPYDPPQRFLDKYLVEDMPEPSVGEWASEYADFPMTATAAFGDFGVDHAKESRRAYYGSVTFVDEQIGRIIDALKRKGMYENTLIVFTADHGDMLGDHHHWRKTYAYQGSAQIPMLMKWPSMMNMQVDRGAKLSYPVELRDVLPTFLDGAGLTIPADMDGDSMLKLVKDKKSGWRKYIDLEHSRCYRPENYWAALTDGKIKYIYHFYYGREQLFDLIDDPGELVDLVNDSDRAGLLELWRERMVDHLAERGDEWVLDGRLQIRKETLVYSPNFPGK